MNLSSIITQFVSKDKKTKEFIEKCRKVHGDRYDYGPTYYVRSDKKVWIRCRVHGRFQQEASAHKRGKNCRACAYGMRSVKQFVEDANKEHYDRYDYSKVRGIYFDGYPDVLFVLKEAIVSIICPNHDRFFQSANNHLQGSGCPDCKWDSRRKPVEQFIAEARAIHGDFYDYSRVKYINMHTPVYIICPKHKEFWQKPTTHIDMQSGCPACVQSKGEKEIARILKKRNVRFKMQKSFEGCRSPLSSNLLKFDFWLYQLEILIEYQGEQHFEPVEYFGGAIKFLECKINDHRKAKFAKKRGFTLLEPDHRIPLNQLESWLLQRLPIEPPKPKEINKGGKIKPRTIGTQTSIFDWFRGD